MPRQNISRRVGRSAVHHDILDGRISLRQHAGDAGIQRCCRVPAYRNNRYDRQAPCRCARYQWLPPSCCQSEWHFELLPKRRKAKSQPHLPCLRRLQMFGEINAADRGDRGLAELPPPHLKCATRSSCPEHPASPPSTRRQCMVYFPQNSARLAHISYKVHDRSAVHDVGKFGIKNPRREQGYTAENNATACPAWQNRPKPPCRRYLERTSLMPSRSPCACRDQSDITLPSAAAPSAIRA